MIVHVVCFKMKEGCSAEEAKEMLLTMREKEETALSVEVGVDFLRSPRSYDLILRVELKDREALERYQTSGYHAHTVKPYMHGVTITERSVAVDYEL
ncbi:MAG: Dabb family protein [Candidatus Gallimonas sp.]